MIVTPSATVSGNREVIVALASKHKLPAVYPYRYMVTSGGLIAYGPDPIDQYRRAAGYVIVSSREKSLPICRFKHPPSLCWSST
jgi:hypothetical protein